ncbi:MAG: transcription-repair coupling factor [Acidobacteriota bacterium]|nr:transcription-repair coupling factor [Acidobacteriota bacterium]
MSLDFINKTDEFKRFLHAVATKERGLVATGLIDASKSYFLSAFSMAVKKQVVFIRPIASELFLLNKQCRFFLSQLSSDIKAQFLPSLSENPYQDYWPSLEAVSSRMNFFYSLLKQPPELTITNLLGLLKPFPEISNLKQMFITVEKGETIGRDRLISLLNEYGYVREDIVNSPGEYALRGGIVDVWSPWGKNPFRIEFSGDDVLSLREFIPSSQRSVLHREHVLIPSLREFPSQVSFFDKWGELAIRKGGMHFLDDIRKKLDALKTGEMFPSFSYLSILNKEHFVSFRQYFKDCIFVIDEFDEVKKEWAQVIEGFQEQLNDLQKQGNFSLPPGDIYYLDAWEYIKKHAIRWQEFVPPSARKTYNFPFQSVPSFKNKIPFFLEYLKKSQGERKQCFLFLSSERIRQRLADLLSQHQIRFIMSNSPLIFPKDFAVVLLTGDLPRGFCFPLERLIFFSEKDIFTDEGILVHRPRAKPFVSFFQDLKTGDYVVHTDYGIGIFKGLVKMDIDNKNQEFIQILYKDGDKLFVPVEDLNLVQKYTQLGTVTPVLTKLGTPTWERIKLRTKKAIEELAKELLQLYAQRKAVHGHSFSGEGTWQSDFEDAFEYNETDDQWRAIKEVIRDMESSSTMDRLLCGDVGYGKTEVAMRACFKAVMDGKQVAVLCPTTVLASQHLKTFRSRMALFPIRIESLTRLQTLAQQKKIVEHLKKGLIDIVIGTHRLLSKDVQFRDLGLLVIDEEQRFGVNHKEKIIQMKANIDVLTMTATPIPRTLNLSLSGLRDISLIETPPKDRLAIHTVITPFSQKLIINAIKNELRRGGQVYFIHNRIDDIWTITEMIQKWVPEAKVAVIHGKTPSLTLERTMIDFIQQKYNVLVSTTIIENGIDIPLVNTLIVNRADRFGLAQLYQLRGRVGRSSRQAVAYFLVPSLSELTPLARERLKALQEFSALGSGFRLAAKDLEIRGAGNFLGAEQHGYMEAVGFDFYMKLLEQTIRELKGEKVEDIKTKINLKADIRIPEEYLPQINLRLNLYKMISSIEQEEDIEKIKEEIQDRYGPIPHGVKNLLRYGLIKYWAQRAKITAIDRVGQKIVLRFSPSALSGLSQITKIMKKHAGSITPQGVVTLKLSSRGETEMLDETIFILKELSLV